MNNSSSYLQYKIFQSSHGILVNSLVGSLYIICGFFGMLLTMLTFMGMYRMKSHRKNSFHFLSFNVLFCDFIGLSIAGIYSGVYFILQPQFLVPNFMRKFFGILIGMAWFMKFWFMNLVALTRFCAIKSRQIEHFEVTVKMKFTVTVIWVGHLIFVALCWYFGNPIQACPYFLTWCHEDSLVGRIMEKYDLYGDILSSVLLLLVNFASLILHKKRKSAVFSVSTIHGAIEAKKHEKMLQLQCVGASCYCLFGCGLWVCFQRFDLPIFVYPLAHFVWLSLHAMTSVIYLIANREIRKSSAFVVKMIGKFLCCSK